MQRESVMHVIHQTTRAAATEAGGRNMPATADAFLALGDATQAVASRVKGWENWFGGSMHPAVVHGSRGHGYKRKKPHRKATPAQLRSLAKARAAKRRLHGGTKRKSTRRSSAKKKKGGRRRARR